MIDSGSIAWEKLGGLVPAIIQDSTDRRILMLGFMNPAALDQTIQTGRVTFWSRTRSTLWTKGETSGNYLELESLVLDCDRDTLLVRVRPRGPVCHTGTPTCFDNGDPSSGGIGFLATLEQIIRDRKSADPSTSYTASLFASGREKILQKLGEEAVEVIVSALQARDRSVEETADLIYHLLVFLVDREISLSEVAEVLRQRSRGE